MCNNMGIQSTTIILGILALGVGYSNAAAAQLSIGLSDSPMDFTAAPFPTNSRAFTDFFSGYEPTQTSVQPQPKITDVVRGFAFPLKLVSSESVPLVNTDNPHLLPPSRTFPNLNAEYFWGDALSSFSTPESLAARNATMAAISGLVTGNSNVSSEQECGACMQGLQLAQALTWDYPWETVSLVVDLCTLFSPTYPYTSCIGDYDINASGGPIAQILSFADFTSPDSIDARMICALQIPGRFCTVPPVSQYDSSLYYNTTLPAVRTVPPPSGKRLKVLHISDFHIDPRYLTGAESACTDYMCCRKESPNRNNATTPSFPAPRYGAFRCDTPYSLAVAALESIPTLTGTVESGFDFTIFTGDIAAHDNDKALSRGLVEYAENFMFVLMKKLLGKGPTYAALGNHDSWPQALQALRSLPEYLADQFSWNYNHVASLWLNEQWLTEDESQKARTHYGGFAAFTKDGLKVISVNTDWWYTANKYNYINMNDPDSSGTLKWLADELQQAENNGHRAWIIGHIPIGWSGSALLNPSDLLSQILERYSPHVIAGVFFGHFHDEMLYNTYANNGTVKDASTAVMLNWIGPSLAPLQNLNSGFRMYEVDSGNFNVMDAHTWYSNVTAYPELDGQTEFGPSYHYEYSYREAYGTNITGWGPNDPLNATWFHKVTEQFELYPSLIDDFHQRQGRQSTYSNNCTSTVCTDAKLCYMRSGTAAQGQACTRGYSSAQSKLR